MLHIGELLPTLQGPSQLGPIDVAEHIRASWAVVFSMPGTVCGCHAALRVE